MISHHQRVAMNTHEFLSELCFQVSKRVIDEYLAAFMAHGDILVVGLKEPHFRKRY
jgi:predicted lactoylglutathione lyase